MRKYLKEAMQLMTHQLIKISTASFSKKNISLKSIKESFLYTRHDLR